MRGRGKRLNKGEVVKTSRSGRRNVKSLSLAWFRIGVRMSGQASLTGCSYIRFPPPAIPVVADFAHQLGIVHS